MEKLQRTRIDNQLSVLTNKKQLNRLKLVMEKADNFEPAIVRESKDAADYLKSIHSQDGDDIVEYFYILALNRQNKTIGYSQISKGGITGTVADPRIILLFAIACGCCSLILCHNHPSGNLKPSKADEELTTKIKEAAKYFDIKLLDHLIISDEGYYSFADDGIL